MLRTSSLLAATAVLFAMSGGAFADPVDDVVRTVEKAVGVDVPDIEIDEPGGIGGVPRGVGGRSAVVGYISVHWVGTDAPSYTLAGALADPNEWTCSDNGGTTTYSVTCLPVPLVLPMEYHCDVLHADVTGASADSAAKTSLDCDSDGVAEAETDAVTGIAWDNDWAVDTRLVTAFTCTIEGSRDYHGGCGDPGLVGVA